MAKWVNTSTGLVVPASEVRELFPGSGLFVHETSVDASSIKVTTTDDRRVPVVTLEIVPASPKKLVDGYAVKLDDNATFDPNTNTVMAQALASQAAQRARQAGAR